MSAGLTLDLVVVVPGKDEEQALAGLLSTRSGSLCTRSVVFKILRHPRHDPGVFSGAEQLLRPFHAQASPALVMFDHDGCGQENRRPNEIALEVNERLAQSGWGDRAAVLVIVPELEVWVWSDSPHVDEALGWGGRSPGLRAWLEQQGLWPRNFSKPPRPKEAVEAAMSEAHLQRSSAIYRQLAETVGLERCQDPSFRQLVTLLRNWFPVYG